MLDVIGEVFSEVVEYLVAEGYVKLEEVFMDETKIEADANKHKVTWHGNDIQLTATEFRMLHYLANHPGRVFTRSQLLDAVHGVAFESYERAIDAHVKNIRRKLEPDPHAPRYLLTVHGVGYRFLP